MACAHGAGGTWRIAVAVIVVLASCVPASLAAGVAYPVMGSPDDGGWPPELSALDDGFVHGYSGSMHGAGDVDVASREPPRYHYPASSGFAETAPPPPPPPPPPRHHESPPPTGAPTALVGAAAAKAKTKAVEGATADAGGRERVQQQRRRGLQPRPDASFNLPASDSAHPAPQVQQVTVQQSDLFEQLDVNQDHVIQSNEIQQFIRDEVGTQDFDDQSEIAEAARHVMETAQLHDEASDNLPDVALSMRDMQLFWEGLGKFMSAAEVAQWVTHAVQLPMYSDVFLANSITGFDFPALLENDGQSIHEDLGVTNRLHRRQIMRAIQMRLLGVGDVPDQPMQPLHSPVSCEAVNLKWLMPADNGVAIHKFLVQRRVAPDGAWDTVYDGPDDFFADTGLSFTSVYDYRLQAWNALGHSNFTTLAGVKPQTTGCSLPITLSFSAIIAGVQDLFTVLALLVFAYRVRQYVRVGGLSALLGPSTRQYLGGKTGGTYRAAQADGVMPGTPPHFDSMDVDDGTRGLSTHDAQAATAFVPAFTPASLTHCVVCSERFAMLRGRRRHHCGRCGQKFCSKHGDTHAHPPFTSCPVPSPCVCNNCIAAEPAIHRRGSGRR